MTPVQLGAAAIEDWFDELPLALQRSLILDPAQPLVGSLRQAVLEIVGQCADDGSLVESDREWLSLAAFGRRLDLLNRRQLMALAQARRQNRPPTSDEQADITQYLVSRRQYEDLVAGQYLQIKAQERRRKRTGRAVAVRPTMPNQ